MTILITGAAGFIGSSMVRLLRERFPERRLVSLDALTYAGHLANLAPYWHDPLHTFIKGDITDPELVRSVFVEHEPTLVFHLAAESHVDRSILGPMAFVKTNVEGTACLLSTASAVWGRRDDVRFIHVSTDEVFGALGATGRFDEQTPYAPRSPYAASKAASDHIARAWHETYELPVIVTNCTNNYGPRQLPEKLIPVAITRALRGEPVPVYGQGENVRDWIHVDDHCAALLAVAERGRVGETYCIGAETELANLELVGRVLDAVDARASRAPGTSRRLIDFVIDRPGHDFRYAMCTKKIREELGWAPSTPIEQGLVDTVGWYMENPEWIAATSTESTRAFERAWYGRSSDGADAATASGATPTVGFADVDARWGTTWPRSALTSTSRADTAVTREFDGDQLYAKLEASGAFEAVGAPRTRDTPTDGTPRVGQEGDDT